MMAVCNKCCRSDLECECSENVHGVLVFRDDGVVRLPRTLSHPALRRSDSLSTIAYDNSDIAGMQYVIDHCDDTHHGEPSTMCTSTSPSDFQTAADMLAMHGMTLEFGQPSEPCVRKPVWTLAPSHPEVRLDLDGDDHDQAQAKGRKRACDSGDSYASRKRMGRADTPFTSSAASSTCELHAAPSHRDQLSEALEVVMETQVAQDPHWSRPCSSDASVVATAAPHELDTSCVLPLPEAPGCPSVVAQRFRNAGPDRTDAPGPDLADVPGSPRAFRRVARGSRTQRRRAAVPGTARFMARCGGYRNYAASMEDRTSQTDWSVPGCRMHCTTKVKKLTKVKDGGFPVILVSETVTNTYRIIGGRNNGGFGIFADLASPDLRTRGD